MTVSTLSSNLSLPIHEPVSGQSGAAKMECGGLQDEVVSKALNGGQLHTNGHDVEIEEGQLIPETPVIEGAPHKCVKRSHIKGLQSSVIVKYDYLPRLSGNMRNLQNL